MDVVALVSDPRHPSVRYRIAQYADHLATAGLTLTLEPLARRPMARLEQLRRPRKDSIVFLQRKLLPCWQTLLLRRSAAALVYDFDDAVFWRDSFHTRGPRSLTRWARFKATLAAADLVIAGNDFLAETAARIVSPERVHVVPTCIDANRYAPADHADEGTVRLVWIGTSSSLRSLERAKAMLESIGRAIPRLALRVICDRFPKFRHLTIEPATWTEPTETARLREADIGISWIPNDAWSQGKCGLKVLQYMAASLPVIASPVGIHRDLVGAEAGYLPNTPADWVRTVASLARDADLRRRLGVQARRRFEEGFQLRDWGPTFASHLRRVAA